MKFVDEFKEKAKRLFDGEYKGLAILCVLQLIAFITIKPIRYDDMFYIESITGVPILEFVMGRYESWTSRVLIDAMIGFTYRYSKLVWPLGTVFLITLIGYSMSKLFLKKENRKELIMMILWLVILYPIERMSSAGWAATTVNYIWPLSFGLFSLISIRKAYDKERIKPYLGILYIIANIFACNQEQMCVVLAVTYILFTIILTARDKKKVSLFMYLQSIISLASLVFVLTTPGNWVRQQTEIEIYFPEFNSLNIIDKLVLGVTTTMGELVVNYYITFIIFSLIMMIYIWDNYKDRLVRGISAAPFIATMCLSFGRVFTEKLSAAVGWLIENFESKQLLIRSSTYTYLGSYIELILSLSIMFCIFISLFLIFKKMRNNIALYVFGCGLASRIMMGFSATIFVSLNRTCIFLEFACLICTLLIWQEFIKKAEKKSKTKVYNVIVCTSIVQYIVSLSYILITHINV